MIRSKKQIIDDYVRKEQYNDFRKKYDMYQRLADHGFINKEDLQKYMLGEKHFGIAVQKPSIYFIYE